jgi:beta-mannosidase
MTWSVLDYPGRPKAAYYTSKRLWQPRILIATEDGTNTILTAVNDTARTFQDSVEWQLVKVDGDVVASGTVSADVPARSAKVIATIPSPAEIERAAIVFYAQSGDPAVTPARRYYVPFRDIQLPPPDVRIAWERSGNRLKAILTSTTAAFGVMVRPRKEILISDDNNVDIPPGGTATVTFEDPSGQLRAEDFEVTIPVPH